MRARIRVVHVLEATIGGTRRHVLDLLHGLSTDYFEQHLVCSLRNPTFQEDIKVLRAAGIRVTVLPMRREISPASDFGALRALMQLLQKEKPDIIHGHSAKGGFLSRLAAQQVYPRPATIYNPHGFPFQMATNALGRRLYQTLERWAGHWTDRLVAAGPSQLALALTQQLVPPGKALLIHNGVDPARTPDPASRETVRDEWGVRLDTPVLGTVAALTPQKDIATLLRAIAQLQVQLPQACCVIIGDGVLRPALEQLAHELEITASVFFLGQRNDVSRLLTGLDMLVLPSLWEGLPYALLEAGLAGLPVVATDIPGNRDLIIPGQTGLLARTGDPAELAAQILALWHSEDRIHMGAHLRDLVLSQYRLEQMLAEHTALYTTLVAS